MRRRIIHSIRHAPLAWFYAISVLIAVLTIPLFLVSGAQEAIDRAFTGTGLPFNTDLITWLRLVIAYPDAALGTALAILQVAAPDIAVLIVVPIAFGWPGLRDLKRRFRFLAARTPMAARGCGLGWCNCAVHKPEPGDSSPESLAITR